MTSWLRFWWSVCNGSNDPWSYFAPWSWFLRTCLVTDALTLTQKGSSGDACRKSYDCNWVMSGRNWVTWSAIFRHPNTRVCKVSAVVFYGMWVVFYLLQVHLVESESGRKCNVEIAWKLEGIYFVWKYNYIGYNWHYCIL